jgi:RNA 2',3'-cyclic 3'-phosphodiesterase
LRLFTAIELTDSARFAIAGEQKRVVETLRRDAGRLRLVKPEQMHLTLVFIGEVDEARGEAIAKLMTGDIPTAPFRIGFGGVGAFPARGAPRVLYLDVREGMQAAIDLHARVADRLAEADVAPDQRPFHPHLTLGRWRESRPSDRPKASISQGRADVAVVDVVRVALFQSRISSSGPAYTRLADARLVCP